MTRARVGLTLPTFVEDPAIPLEIASVAEASGLDGVFVFDHLFRSAPDGSRRPSLEAVALLGAVAASTQRITVGTLVLRAWLRPPASSAVAITTTARIAPGRVIAGIGSGDSESRKENDAFGLGFGSVDERVERLRATVRIARDLGAPVWIGGHAPPVREAAAAEADGWNAWECPVDEFGRWAREIRAAAQRDPFECSWGGLVVLDESDAAAQERAERLGPSPGTIVGGPQRVADAIAELGEAGADWVILGALDARAPRTARLLGESVMERVAS